MLNTVGIIKNSCCQSNGTMSRIVSRSEQEPLMRLQRPSSASSQDTAHLVNACLRHFLDNSSTPVPLLDRARVDNLRVSSAEQRDGYHKRYVELLNTVCWQLSIVYYVDHVLWLLYHVCILFPNCIFKTALPYCRLHSLCNVQSTLQQNHPSIKCT